MAWDPNVPAPVGLTWDIPHTTPPGPRPDARAQVDGVIHEWAPVWHGQALDAVQQLHSPRDFRDLDGHGWALCAECRQTWPCGTIKAIQRTEAEK